MIPGALPRSVRPGAPPVTLTSTTRRPRQRNSSARRADRSTIIPVGWTVGTSTIPLCRSITISAGLASNVVNATASLLQASLSQALCQSLDQRRRHHQLSKLSRAESGRQRRCQLLRTPGVLVAQHPRTGLGEREDGTPSITRMGMALDQATRLEPPQSRPHRLHTDLLGLGQLGYRGRTTAIQSLQGRHLRQAQVALSLHLTKLANAQANTHLQSRSDVINSVILRHT